MSSSLSPPCFITSPPPLTRLISEQYVRKHTHHFLATPCNNRHARFTMAKYSALHKFQGNCISYVKPWSEVRWGHFRKTHQVRSTSSGKRRGTAFGRQWKTSMHDWTTPILLVRRNYPGLWKQPRLLHWASKATLVTDPNDSTRDTCEPYVTQWHPMIHTRHLVTNASLCDT